MPSMLCHLIAFCDCMAELRLDSLSFIQLFCTLRLVKTAREAYESPQALVGIRIKLQTSSTLF